MEKDIIKIKIKCSSEECEKLREEGLFFQVIANALGINRDDIEEIEEVENNTEKE